MTPDEVLEAFEAHQFDRIRSAASPEFRDEITAEEMRRVWHEQENACGPVRSIGPNLVMHDVALHCEHGEAHLQVVYQEGEITGLVLLPGPPTGRFGQ